MARLRRIPYGRYCLYCYAPVGRSRKASVHCERCGRQLLRVDRESCWTLEPRFIRAEKVVKIGIWVAGVLGYACAAIVGLGAWFGFALGYVVVVPIFCGLLHATASKITHRGLGIRFDVLWAVVLPGIVIIISSAVFLYMVNWANREEVPYIYEQVLPPLALFIFFTSPVLAIVVARRVEGWKANRVLSGMKSFHHRPAGS